MMTTRNTLSLGIKTNQESSSLFLFFPHEKNQKQTRAKSKSANKAQPLSSQQLSLRLGSREIDAQDVAQQRVDDRALLGGRGLPHRLDGRGGVGGQGVGMRLPLRRRRGGGRRRVGLSRRAVGLDVGFGLCLGGAEAVGLGCEEGVEEEFLSWSKRRLRWASATCFATLMFPSLSLSSSLRRLSFSPSLSHLCAPR